MTPEESMQLTMQEAKKTRNRTIAFVGVPTALVGYSIYKIGKLPDQIAHEKGYVITGLVGGLALLASGINIGSSTSKKQENAVKVGGITLMTTTGYALARGLFKQNPKVSLIAGAVLAAGTYYLLNHPQLLKKSISQPTTPVENPKPPITVVGYPAGLKEGDYIRYKLDATIYLLKDSKKLPITYDWMVKYAGDKWGSVIEIEPSIGDMIPVGETLVV